ncbi:MAG: hypothetical protein R3Y33_07720 [Clostridia bacterium]
MSKNAMNVAKTVGIGLVAGTAVMAIGSTMMSQKKKKAPMKSMKKSAGKAIHTVNEMLTGMETMLK